MNKKTFVLSVNPLSVINEYPHIMERSKEVVELAKIFENTANVSFINLKKKKVKCPISTVEVENKKGVDCWWCRYPIPSDCIPVCCPVRYHHNQITRTTANIKVKESVHIIRQCLTSEESKKYKDEEDFQHKNFYETVGFFCSFNCCFRYVLEKEKVRDTLYDDSRKLLYRLYTELYGKPVTEFVPSPDWEILEKAGGSISISDYRKAFTTVSFEFYGNVRFLPLMKICSKNVNL